MSRVVMVIVMLVLVSAPAAAQDAGDPDAYQQGLDALEAGDLETAVSRFEAAFDADASVRNALALAATLQESLRLGEAIALYDRILAEELGAPSEAQRSEVERARRHADAQRAVLSVQVESADALDVELDGDPVGAVRRGAALTLRVDPGEHRIRGRVGEARTPARVVRVAPAEEAVVRLEAPVVSAETDRAEVPSPAPTEPPSERGRTVAPWVVLGLAAVPLAVGIGAGIAFEARASEARAAGSHRDAQPFLDEARPFGIVANVSFGLAGAMAIAGLVWGLITLGGDDEETTVSLGPAGASVRGAF